MHQPSCNVPEVSVERRIPNTVPLILASASPRRRELLTQLGAIFTIVTTEAEEQDDPVHASVIAALPSCPLALNDHPTLRAWRKAQAAGEEVAEAIILAADTVVVLDGKVLNKPRDAAHACAMLGELAGREHTVYTGLCVMRRASGELRDYSFDLVASQVTIAPLDAEVIARYVATQEPLDKAGAYGIQGLGGRLVQQVVGSYTAVVGLPLSATWHLLTAAGVSGLQDPLVAYQNWLHIQGKEPLPCPPTLP